jgi:DNA-binding transcriptional ArsR family regulator
MPGITWDSGTGYDLFASLYILHHPVTFGVRPSWAAGVRSRLPASARSFLESAFSFLPIPLAWIHGLPSSRKSAADVLTAMQDIPPQKRLAVICDATELARRARPVWEHIRRQGSWETSDLETLRMIFEKNQAAIWPGMFPAMASAWAHAEEFGEQLLEGLSAYCQNFFFEEEERILPVVSASLLKSREMAQVMSPAELVRQILPNVNFDPGTSDLVLVPSLWAGPLVFYNYLHPHHYIVLYPARPDTMPLVPGGRVPSEMLSALKAMADPTRMRILRYLVEQPLTLAELARRLRLRPPTVLHHLYFLRQAELVEVTFLEDNERRYAFRRNRLDGIVADLQTYLEHESPKES